MESNPEGNSSSENKEIAGVWYLESDVHVAFPKTRFPAGGLLVNGIFAKVEEEQDLAGYLAWRSGSPSIELKNKGVKETRTLKDRHGVKFWTLKSDLRYYKPEKRINPR
jgi:hypothetical protein